MLYLLLVYKLKYLTWTKLWVSAERGRRWASAHTLFVVPENWRWWLHYGIKCVLIRLWSCLDDSLETGALVVIILVVILFMALIIAVVAWFLYAYRHPNSRSGRWLIEVGRTLPDIHSELVMYISDVRISINWAGSFTLFYFLLPLPREYHLVVCWLWHL